MTHLAKRKTKLRFETAETIRGRAICVEALAYTVRLREKGRRRTYEASWESVFWHAVRIAADQERRARKARRHGDN